MEVKAKILMKHFQAPRRQCLLWEEGALSTMDFRLFNLADHMHTQKDI